MSSYEERARTLHGLFRRFLRLPEPEIGYHSPREDFIRHIMTEHPRFDLERQSRGLRPISELGQHHLYQLHRRLHREET